MRVNQFFWGSSYRGARKQLLIYVILKAPDCQKYQICVLLGAFPTKELTALLIRKCQDKEMSRIMIE